MDWTVEDCTDHVVVTTRGAFDAAEHRRMVEDIVTRDFWRPGTAVLFDHRELSFGGSGYQQMLEARENHLAHNTDIGDGKAAVVMGSRADFGLGRQFELLTEGQVDARMHIFLDPVEALAWLLADE
ncbi:MAG TPA: hypothetical protein VF006_28270 [Longimicrobium sp.]